MNLLVVGDCHGYEGMFAAARLARELEADAVIQLGDCWSENLARLISPPFHVIPRNHEQGDLWARGEFGAGIVGHM
ncbi:metallophosphoesterase, partial [Candidatus Woesearchaeota archaeon]|nr:metallophosphoesterase [Candidatus Woesearchaeota archaeon]